MVYQLGNSTDIGILCSVFYQICRSGMSFLIPQYEIAANYKWPLGKKKSKIRRLRYDVWDAT